MRTAIITLALTTASIISGPIASAEIQFGKDGLAGDFGKVQLRGRFSASVQAALIEPLAPGEGRNDSNLDGSARISLEYITDSAIVIGIVGEVDSGNVEIEGFERDEFYAYIAADWGRIEIGENDGPGDTLSFHAPTTGLGQVRGDFARYTGSVALLSPYDTRDAAKITYLSPPIGGFRGGVSYSPEFNINEHDPNPLRRLLQDDVVEVAGQYNTVAGGVTFGVSGSYVTGSAVGVAGREDIQSWGIGTEFNRGAWTLGAAYVDRGRSNLLPTAKTRNEWNAGVLWDGEKWSVAGSVAISQEGNLDISRYGVGGTYDLTDNVYVAVDAVLYKEEFDTGLSRDGTVGLVELGARF